MSMILTRPVEETQEAEKLYTVEEFLELDLPDTDKIEYELIGGRIVGKPSYRTDNKHARVVSKIGAYLNIYAGLDDPTHKRGDVYDNGSTLLGQPRGSNYVDPDLSFVKIGRVPAEFRGAIPVAPDLVVEVNSPSDTTQGIYDKIQAYLANGVPMVWSVFPFEPYMVVYEPGEHNLRFYGFQDELTGGDVLPGFKVAVRKFFE